ncbi:MAG: alpha/beta hydrolase [Algoriphagus sp.]|uniref:alpha/beta hydrolase n=1 Tax=Algoriphagus sp. TaxID=1872435 RepID=UPI00185D1024|nr:alpha/beta hydrolase-fold protein [Algoriphagus sp.]NVJ86089.1 alpha/beta hydrolase [Algoriphagus sp.]
MRKYFLTLIFLAQLSFLAYSQEEIVIGEKHNIYSEVLNEERTYWVSLPESYSNNASDYKTYPVLILLDGNIHFNFIAGMVQYHSADRNRSLKIPEMIVVGIQNVDRRRDFTPDKIITVRENNTGGGDRFLSFLEKELIPEIDKKYRTEPYRILYGHSLGGLLATHAYLKENTLFNSFLAIDPSFGTWDAQTMDQKLESISPQTFQRYIYFATANWGKQNLTNRDRHVRFYESLNRLYEGTLRARLDYFENESHASVPPIAFLQGITTIYEGYGISFREIKTIDQLNGHFQGISDRLGYKVNPPETLVNQVGYAFIRSNDENEKMKGLDFFLLNTQNFPGSFNAFDSLGEAYEAVEDTTNAILGYKRSLELNPENEHAKSRILILQEEN